METTLVDMTDRERAMPAGVIRLQGMADWIDDHASGSLRKSKKLGFSYRNLYLEERVAHDFGWAFKIAPRSRITFGDAMMEGDCHALTEACWHSERLLSRNPFPDTDYYEVKYIYEADVTGKISREGVGLILRQTSAKWLPAGHIVYAIIAEFYNDAWRDAVNPC
jgi:hypothetical protein